MGKESKERGIIYSFYSYKGGTGRTMALANTAALLARWGHSVLVVDWDLEAPGLQRFFETGNDKKGVENPKPGLVELIDGFASGVELDWRDCVARRHEVSIIRSGLDDGEYARRVQEINFDSLFADAEFGTYIEKLRDEWAADYEFVLIDSRTGVTDIGGICTVHLPDVLVVFFTATDSSTRGVLDVVKRAKVARSKLPVDRAPLAVLPVPARDESRTEYQQAAFWKKKYSALFDDLYRDWLPKAITTSDAIDALRIPYVPFWSFGERLPVLLEGARDTSSISFAFELLARLLANRLDWYKAVESRSLPPTAVAQARVPKAGWLEKHRELAKVGLASSSRSGFMEVYHYCIDVSLDKRQTELLSAARQAAVHMFGWPIGVVLESDLEGKPRPIADGLFAEIHSIGNAYDYWALNREGDFYSLMSLFEDERSEGNLYFDTRIIRVTETILHSIGLYKALGVGIGARVELAVSHGGLRGRILNAASPARLSPGHRRASVEDQVVSPRVQYGIGIGETEILELVKLICAPLFEVFDFQVFNNSVYSGIVTQFINGRIS